MTDEVIPSTVRLVLTLVRGFEASGFPERADELLEALADAILTEQDARYRRRGNRERKERGE